MAPGGFVPQELLWEGEVKGVCSAEDQAGELGSVGLALEAGWG